MHYRAAAAAKSSDIELQHAQPSPPLSTTHRRRRKRPITNSRGSREEERSTKPTTFITIISWTCLVSIFIAGVLRYKWMVSAPLVLDLDLYESTYRLAHTSGAGSAANNKPDESSTERTTSTQLRDEWLQTSYGSQVTSCPLTILFLDPRLGDPHYGPGQSAWFALESAAHALPDACVLLLTSDCFFEDFDEHLNDRVRQNIYDKSLPLFRRMIERGRVRMKIADWFNYKLKSCSDFSNLSSMLMNVHFWRNEFLQDVDSDSILTLQDDATLCGSTVENNDGDNHPVSFMESLLDMYQQYAYVGAPWPPVANKLIPFPVEGMCQGMEIRWRTWLLPQQKWERAKDRGDDKSAPKPDVLLKTDFPQVCQDGQGPVGNGGLSLRSREWMIRAIETCPHALYSGLDTNSATRHYACKVIEDVNEDFYFSVVLTGIGAPLPAAVEASTFAVESLWPEDALELYDSTMSSIETLSSRPVFQYEGRWYTAPFGIHKAFWYHPNDLLRSDALHSVCPFFRYVFEPSDSRWRQVKDNTVDSKAWTGIGT